MFKPWYKNTFYWLAILAFTLAIYVGAYGTLGGVVMGFGDLLINVLHIPYEIVKGIYGGLQILCMIGIFLIPIVILVVVIINWRETRRTKKFIGESSQKVLQKRDQIISDISSLFDSIEDNAIILSAMETRNVARRPKIDTTVCPNGCNIPQAGSNFCGQCGNKLIRR